MRRNEFIRLGLLVGLLFPMALAACQDTQTPNTRAPTTGGGGIAEAADGGSSTQGAGAPGTGGLAGTVTASGMREPRKAILLGAGLAGTMHSMLDGALVQHVALDHEGDLLLVWSAQEQTFLTKVSLASGDVAWSQQVAEVQSLQASLSSEAPSTAAVYLLGRIGTGDPRSLVRLDASGKVVWSLPTDREVFSPLFDGSVALAAHTWVEEAPVNEPNEWCDPVWVTKKQGTLWLDSVDAATGELLETRSTDSGLLQLRDYDEWGGIPCESAYSDTPGDLHLDRFARASIIVHGSSYEQNDISHSESILRVDASLSQVEESHTSPFPPTLDERGYLWSVPDSPTYINYGDEQHSSLRRFGPMQDEAWVGQDEWFKDWSGYQLLGANALSQPQLFDTTKPTAERRDDHLELVWTTKFAQNMTPQLSVGRGGIVVVIGQVTGAAWRGIALSGTSDLGILVFSDEDDGKWLPPLELADTSGAGGAGGAGP